MGSIPLIYSVKLLFSNCMQTIALLKSRQNGEHFVLPSAAAVH